MDDYKLGIMETKFADIIWNNAPVASGELVKICAAQLGWKKSTTYTMLKRLCDRHIFENRGGTVVILITKDEFAGLQSEKFVEDTFDGSLPRFLASFVSRKKLSDQEIEELKKMIEESRG